MNGWIREDVDDEVAGGRASLATKCDIPVSDIQGFRQPYLQASPTVREVSTPPSMPACVLPLLSRCHCRSARQEAGGCSGAGGRQPGLHAALDVRTDIVHLRTDVVAGSLLSSLQTWRHADKLTPIRSQHACSTTAGGGGRRLPERRLGETSNALHVT